ncbi:hypothetical protein B0H16DRAFT_1612453 [Mycena metata]|uniref:Uncharacterized protein n=1 Tax=Mycena metata TaxID=1033252 RepID=A0AAD7HC14_9AGAR|nr:hypothetical protein B0H16DRAFT_1612453 [Mycena metata]
MSFRLDPGFQRHYSSGSLVPAYCLYSATQRVILPAFAPRRLYCSDTVTALGACLLPPMSNSYTSPPGDRTGPPPAYNPRPQPHWWGPTRGAYASLPSYASPLAPVEQTPLLPQQQNVERKRQTLTTGTTLVLMSPIIMFFIFMIVSRVCDAYDQAGPALDRNRMRREWEAEMRDQEKIRLERIRAGFIWDDVKGDQHCLQHGTRRYTARIANVPREYDPVTACAETAVEIHGMRIPNPNECEDRGCGGVIGHWLVSHSEPTCATHFDNFKDKGCTSHGSGRRRIESHLENLQPGDDWRSMCSTTPAHFWGHHFDSPGVCENWGKYGIWGIWEIEDSWC